MESDIRDSESEIRYQPLFINVAVSIISYFGTVYLIPRLKENFIKHLYGNDMCKRNRYETKM